MRRLGTAVLVVAVAAIAVAALVDVFVGGSRDSQRTFERAGRSATTTSELPVCGRDQLALELEVLGGTNAVALRHVNGPPCQAADLSLHVYVTIDGRRSEIPLGQESVLDGPVTPGLERVVPFSICQDGRRFSAAAIAGPYRTSGEVQPGGENCRSAIREVAVDLSREPGTTLLHITPLDTVTHVVSFLIDLPRRADLRVTVRAGISPLLEVLDRPGRKNCRHIGRRDSCRIDYGVLGEAARGQWTLFVHKRSEGRAHVSFAISFIPATA